MVGVQVRDGFTVVAYGTVSGELVCRGQRHPARPLRGRQERVFMSTSDAALAKDQAAAAGVVVEEVERMEDLLRKDVFQA